MPIPAVPPTGGGGGGGPVTPGAVLATPTLALGGIEFNRSDSDGVEWFCEKLTGWDSFTTAGPLEELSGDHGAAAGEAFLTSRVMTIDGFLTAPDLAARDAAVDRFMNALPANYDGTVLRVDERVPKQAEVRVSGSPTLDRLDYTATFTVGIVARDPRKYATSSTRVSVSLPLTVTGLVPPLTPPLLLDDAPAGDRLRLGNVGSFPTGALLRIGGPIANPRVTRDDTGQSVWWQVNVDAGQFLDVDMRLRQAWLEGTAYRPAGFGSSWWTVPPGGCDVTFAGDGIPGMPGAGSLTVETRSAWR